MSYLSSGSRFKVETAPPVDEVDMLRSKLRPDFLAAAGWDPVELILCPPRHHQLLGIRKCSSTDCLAPAASAGVDLCQTCERRRKHGGLSVEDFVLVPTGKRNRGERFCVVSRCERPAHQRSGLCAAHQYRFSRHSSTTIAEWMVAAQPDPLPSFGPCLVPSCPRVAAAKNQICLPHGQQWNRIKNSETAPAFSAWVQAGEPSDTSRMVVLKGLPDRVVVEVLLGLQWRTDDHTRTSMTVLRALVRNARRHQVDSIFELLEAPLDWEKRDMAALVRAMTLAVRRSLSSPEVEQRRDRWDLAIFGGKGQIDFTVIHQPWLREAAKHWVLEDLPLHRGRQATATAKQTVRCIGQLSWNLRHSRDDQGLEPKELGRTDILRFTNRLAHLQRAGTFTATKRHFISGRVRRFLEDTRSLGLTRTGQPLEGLPDDFRLRASDVPREPKDDTPGRDLPIPVLRMINAQLPLLEERSGVELRRLVEVLIDTGRRPEEVCQLPWDCLDTSADGQHVLIYTDSKNNRPHRRLPIGAETAELICTYRDDLRRRFPQTPLDRLALFPRRYRNPNGTFHIPVPTLATSHRAFITMIADQLRDEAGQPFPASVVVTYAYRHSYAQRHADNGTPPDVLRDLMGHTSMQTTTGYYRVTEKRVRGAVDQVARHQFDGQGRRVFGDIAGLVNEEHARLRVGQTAVPFGICTEPTNVKAGGHACPYKFTCIGCGHFRSDASYLPELKSYLQQLLADRERILAATDIQEWAKAKTAPSSEEIDQLRRLIRRVEDELDQLTTDDQARIREAVDVVRSARQTVSLGMPSIRTHPKDDA